MLLIIRWRMKCVPADSRILMVVRAVMVSGRVTRDRTIRICQCSMIQVTAHRLIQGRMRQGSVPRLSQDLVPNSRIPMAVRAVTVSGRVSRDRATRICQCTAHMLIQGRMSQGSVPRLSQDLVPRMSRSSTPRRSQG